VAPSPLEAQRRVVLGPLEVTGEAAGQLGGGGFGGYGAGEEAGGGRGLAVDACIIVKLHGEEISMRWTARCLILSCLLGAMSARLGAQCYFCLNQIVCAPQCEIDHICTLESGP
jgi:hypothetical protein